MSCLMKSDVIEALNEDMETSLMCYEDENTKAVIRWCYESMAREIERLPECRLENAREVSYESGKM